MFGGGAWERTTNADGTPGQWYLHLFDLKQPDWNWDNPAVADEFDAILRFWFDRGVDGFRIDVANSMAKAPGLPDVDLDPETGRPVANPLTGSPYMNQPHVHDILRRWRTVADSYADSDLGARVFVSEAWVTPASELAKYIRPDELHTHVQLRRADVRVVGGVPAQRDRPDAAGDRCGRRAAHLGAGQPRHDPGGHPLRALGHRGAVHRRRHGPRRRSPGSARCPRERPTSRWADGAPGPRCCWSWRCPGGAYVYQGDELGSGGGRGHPRRAAAGPDLGAVRSRGPRARRVPGADPVVGHRGPVRFRLRRQPAVAAAARGLGAP